MKDYDETVESVFKRMEEYEAKKKRERKKIAVTAACMCLIAVGAVAIIKPFNNAGNGEIPATLPPR